MGTTYEQKREQETIKPNAPLSRQQRRFKERIEKEAHETHNKLVQRFIDYLVNHEEPQYPDIQHKIYEISAQWKVYCKAKQLNPSAKEMVFNNCTAIFEDFKKQKEEPKEIV